MIIACNKLVEKALHTYTALKNSGAKYISNKMQRQTQKSSVCLGNASAKSCERLSRNLCISCQQWLWHTSAFCQRL